MAEVSIEFLKSVLDEMESMWDQIDGEWGPTTGGLERLITEGKEPVIAELRRIISESSR